MGAGRKRAKVIPIAAPKTRPVHPFDQAYGTDTGGLIPGKELLTGHANDAHVTAYYAVAPSILDELVELWLGSRPRYGIDRYTFLDVGAGKGRALIGASLHPFLEVVGVELNPAMAAIAWKNLSAFAERASALAPVRVVEGDALEVPLPKGPTLAFLFHPFEAPVMRRFLRRVESHYGRDATMPFDLLYVNAEHAAVVERNGRFKRLFWGKVPMSTADHLADLAEIAEQEEYGSTGDEICGIWRLEGRSDEAG